MKKTLLLRRIPMLAAAGGALAAQPCWALDLNMPRGVTPMSNQIYDLHMMGFWVMMGIAVVVFGALIWSIVFHRRSRRPEAAQFHENTKLEVLWSVAPFLILLGMAIPSTVVLLRAQDFHHAQLKVQITGYQWLWHYEYLTPQAKPVYGFYSRLALASEERMGLNAPKSPWSDPNYLEEVDHPLVVPTHEKILLLVTSGDVIHSWWVPDLGGKQDAIPGFVNQMWIEVEKPGVYRGVCNQLCGGGHAYMPIVVVAKPKAEFERWLKARAASSGTAGAAQAADLQSGPSNGRLVATTTDGDSG
jgi:cytochrome c oxidase subunit II